jgi:HK97 family phage portal protein
MGLWQALENLFRGPSSRAAGPFDDGRRQSYAAAAGLLPRFELGTARWPDFDVAHYDADAYRKLALVFRCLSLIAHAAGTAKVRVYDEANAEAAIPDHPMRRLIRQPNPQMGEARFWGTVALRAGIAGFCVVEKERDGFGDVVALNPLRSSCLKAIPMGRGVYDWEYRIPGQAAQTLPAEDVVPFTWADAPDGSPYGLPPLATCVRDLAIADKLTEFLGNLLDRGGVPMWMLIPDPDAVAMDQETLDDWTEAFLRRRGGFDRRGVPWFAEGIKDAKQLSYDPAELAMQAVRDLSENAICMAFGVPALKAGIRLGLEHVTENATASIMEGAFYRDTIVPLWSRFDDALTTGLLPDFEPPGSSISLEFDDSDVDALQEDRNAKATAFVIPGFNGGLLSNHMALRELGLPVPDGLPEWFQRPVSVDVVPAGDPLQLATPATTTSAPPSPSNGQQGALGSSGPSRMRRGRTTKPQDDVTTSLLA